MVQTNLEIFEGKIATVFVCVCVHSPDSFEKSPTPASWSHPPSLTPIYHFNFFYFWSHFFTSHFDILICQFDILTYHLWHSHISHLTFSHYSDFTFESFWLRIFCTNLFTWSKTNHCQPSIIIIFGHHIHHHDTHRAWHFFSLDHEKSFSISRSYLKTRDWKMQDQ